MKKIVLLCLASLLPATMAHAAFSLSGTALNNATGLSVGDVGVFIISNDGTGFASLTNIVEGFSLTNTATYGSSFSVFTGTNSNTVQDVFGNLTFGSGVATDLGVDGINTGDAFAIIVFATSTTNTVAGDTYRIYTNTGWTVGTDGTFDFPGGYSTFSGAPVYTGTVSAIPEPTAIFLSSIGGLLLLRRRRND